MGHYDPKLFDGLMIQAERGDRDAQYRMGLMYATEGGDDGIVDAHKWFNLAAMAGDPRARAERQELAELMSPAQIAQAQKLARAWKTAH
jgi:hypothetical protein